jgi:aspartate/methionine/tyrosine aminotransferase
LFAERTNWNRKANRLSEALARHRAARKPLLDLTASNPTQCGFEYDASAILQAFNNPGNLAYEPNPKGLETARRAVGAYYASRGDEGRPDDIVLTSSTSEAYSFIFRLLCNPGDSFLVPQPSYPLFDFLADLHDVKLVPSPLVYDHGWQIDFQALERALSPRDRGVIVVHPNNPTGHFCRPEDIARLNEICAQQEMAIVADEVFLDFGLDGEKRSSFTANADALTFTLSGLSKISGLPQMKLAWLVVNGPARVKDESLSRLELIADTFLSVSRPVQLAASALLERRAGFQTQLMARVRKNLGELDAQLAAQKSCSHLSLEGGWYAVLRVPATRSDEDLALELLTKHDTYVHPGHFYDFPSDGYFVVSLITPEVDFAEGIKRLLSVF